MSDVQSLMPEVLRGNSSIYASMSRLAREHGAADLAQGFPSMSGPPEMLEHAAKALVDGPQQYTDPRGPGYLRGALAANAKMRFGVELDTEEQVVITTGAQDALGSAMLGLLQPGDEVLFIEPFYNPVVPCARLAGATLRFVSLTGPDFRLDEEQLQNEMSSKTKLIVYNSPNNPSGHVFTTAELQMLARACHNYDAYLIADEVYEHLVFDGYKHVSALEIPELAERAVVISSFSKTYLTTGWRVGWAMGAAPLVAAIAKVHSLMSFCLPAFLCEGTRYAIEELPAQYLQDFIGIHQRKRDFLCGKLQEAGFDVSVPQGTFFCSLDMSKLLRDSEDDISLCLALPESVGVAAVPMSLSWDKRRQARSQIRLCFSKDDELLERAVSAFGKWLTLR